MFSTPTHASPADFAVADHTQQAHIISHVENVGKKASSVMWTAGDCIVAKLLFARLQFLLFLLLALRNMELLL